MAQTNKIEASTGQAQADTAPATSSTPPAAPVVEKATWADMVKDVTPARAQEMSTLIAAAFEDRMTFEHRTKPGNETIQKKMKAAKAKMITLGHAGVMVAAQVSPAFVNREINEGKRFNIYSIDKMNDLLGGISSGAFHNAVNLAVMRSMFRFRAEGVEFTGEAAQAAVSDKIRVSNAMKKILVRHTVSQATAPTQTSSTMNALAILGAVKNVGPVKFPIFQLTDAPVTDEIARILKVA